MKKKQKKAKKQNILAAADRRRLENWAAELLPGYDFAQEGEVTISAAVKIVAAENGLVVEYHQAREAIKAAHSWAAFITEVGEFIPRQKGCDRQRPVVIQNVVDRAIKARPVWQKKAKAIKAAAIQAIEAQGLKWRNRQIAEQPLCAEFKIYRSQEKVQRPKKNESQSGYFDWIAATTAA